MPEGPASEVTTIEHARLRQISTEEPLGASAGRLQRNVGRGPVTKLPDGGHTGRGSSLHVSPSRSKPGSHSKPQTPFTSHVAAAWEGAGQGSQLVPQVRGERLAPQLVPHA